MTENLIFDGKVYISSRRAAENCGYSQDYIGQLIRSKKVEARMVGRSWFVSQDSLNLYQESLGAEALLPQLRKSIPSPMVSKVPQFSDIAKKVTASMISLAVVGSLGGGYYFADASVLRNTADVLENTGNKINNAIVGTYSDLVESVHVVADAYVYSISNVGKDLNVGVKEIASAINIAPQLITSSYMKAVLVTGDSLASLTSKLASVTKSDGDDYVAAPVAAVASIDNKEENLFVSGVKDVAVKVYDSVNNFFASLFNRDGIEITNNNVVVKTPTPSTSSVSTSSTTTKSNSIVVTGSSRPSSSAQTTQPVQAVNNYYTTSGITPLTLATELAVLRADLEVKIRNAQHTAELAIANSRSSRDRAGERATNTTTTVVQTNTLEVPTLSDGCVEVVSGMLTSVGTSCGTGGSGVTTFNGLIASTQTLATTSNNGGWGFSSTGSVHTLNIPTASASNVLGLLSNTDWSTFNNKQAAGNYITALTGDATASGPGSAALTLATVNSNTGSFGSSTAIPTFTVNGKGLITAAGTAAVVAPAGTLTGATLAANVLNSSLTSLGTVAQLAFTNASGTNATISGDLNLTGLNSVILSVDANGKVVATTTGAGGSGTVSSGTAGQVAYYGANGTTVTGTSTLFFNNGNIGVGTTTANAKVAIIGSSDIAQLLIRANSTQTGNIMQVQSSGGTDKFLVGSGIVEVSSGVALRVGSAGSNAYVDISTETSGGLNSYIKARTGRDLYLGGDAGTQMGLITGVAYVSGTNRFGVGTSSPSARLAVVGNAGTQDLFNLASSTGVGSMFIVKSNGNVGIGSTTPTNNFEVNGSGYFSGSLTAGNITATGTLAIKSLSSTVLAVDQNGNIIATTTPTGGSGTVNSGLTGQVPYYAAGGTALTATSTLFLLGGNIGIGTTTPSSKVTISADALGATPDDSAGIRLTNGTLAQNNSQQAPPGIVFEGSGWKTNATAGSQPILLKQTFVPTQSTANPGGTFTLASAVNGGAYVTIFSTNTNGNLSVSGVSGTNASITIGTSGPVAFGSQSRIYNDSDGVIRLTNNANNGFSRLQFGSNTSSAPSIKRVGAGLAFRLADDSADATTTMAAINVSSTTLSSYFAGNVGIGSTTPSNAFEVSGNGYFSGSLTAGNITATGTLAIKSLSSTVLAVDQNGNIIATTTPTGGSGTVNSGLTGQVPYYAAGGTTLTATSTIFILDGNVGIGTTTPAHQLSVRSSGSAVLQYAQSLRNPNATVGAATGVLFGVEAEGVGGAAGKGGIIYKRTGTWGKGDFQFLQSSANNSSSAALNDAVMTITNLGLVGIGTTSPIDILVARKDQNAKTLISVMNGTTGVSADAGFQATNSTNATAGFLVKSNTAGVGLNNMASIEASNGLIFLTDSNSASGGTQTIQFRVGGYNANQERMRLTTTGLGVGTTTPSNAFEVSGSGYFSGDITAGNITATGTLAIKSLSSTVLAVDQNGNVIATTTPTGGSGTVNSGLTGQVPYYAAGGTTLTATSTIFLSNGNFGVGTSSPATTLDVWGNFGVGTSSTRVIFVDSGSGLININHNTASPFFGNISGSELQITGVSSGSADLSLIRADSNTNPGENLGTINFGTIDGLTTANISIRGIADENMGGSNKGAHLEFLTSDLGNGSAATRMVITGNGLVGIGTTTPAARLSITASTSPIDVVRFASSTNVGTMFVVKSTGNVGIGTDNPQQLLHVYRSTDGPPVRFEDSNGYCEIDPTSTSWVCTSDRNLKKDITNISTNDTLSRISQLQAVSFRWKTQETDDLRYGFVAQDVEAIFPELVTTASNGIKSVAYGGLTPFMVEAIKALNMSVEDLKTRVASVEGRISAVESLLGTAVVNSSSTVGSVSTSTVMSIISDWFSSIGSIFADNVTTKNLTVGDTSNFAAAGITVLDRGTGQPACMYVENGVITSRPGECGAVTGVGNNNNVTTSVGETTNPDTDTSTTTDTTINPVIEENATTTDATSESVTEEIIAPEPPSEQSVVETQ